MAIPQQEKFDHGSGMRTTAKPTQSPAGEAIDFDFPVPEPQLMKVWDDVPDDVLKPVTHLSNKTTED